MAERTLEIDHVSKEYRLGAIGAGTLSADLNSWFARIRGREDPNRKIGDTMPTGGHEYFFALKDICLSAGRGDALALVRELGVPLSDLPDDVQEDVRAGMGFDDEVTLEKWLESVQS